MPPTMTINNEIKHLWKHSRLFSCWCDKAVFFNKVVSFKPLVKDMLIIEAIREAIEVRHILIKLAVRGSSSQGGRIKHCDEI